MLELVPVVEIVPLEYVRVWRKLKPRAERRRREIRFQLRYGRGV